MNKRIATKKEDKGGNYEISKVLYTKAMNDEKYTIAQNVSEKDNSKIQIKDENGNLVYVIELSYDEEKTKSKLHM